MIARRYHTTVEAIVRRNGLTQGKKIYPGQKLHIEEVEAHLRFQRYLADRRAPRPEPEEKPDEKAAAKGQAPPREEAKQNDAPEPPKRNQDDDARYERKPARPGYVILVRRGEVVRGQLIDRNGKLVERTAQRIDRLLRARRVGKIHPIDRRLLRLIASVSDHFGGRTLVVVSGYRPFSPKQYTKNSRHNFGAAIDFRVAGVPERALFDVCRRERGVGCGFYPTTGFVHMDVRQHKTEWTDFSGPGERPRYAHRPQRKGQDSGDKAKTMIH
jgi:uncharacterized protein YcbK (DUF882 family)